MNSIITTLFLLISLLGISHGHHGRMIHNLQPLQYTNRDTSCTCTCDDLGSLVALVRSLEDKDAASASKGGYSHAEELIMKLVNALIQITTDALAQNKCHCPPNWPQAPTYASSGTSTSSSNFPTIPASYQSGGNSNGAGGYRISEEGVINVDLLKPHKKDNVAQIDLVNKPVVGVGLSGGGDSSGASGYRSSEEVLINADVLNPHKKDNVAQIDLVNKPVVGVGLGGGGADAASRGNQQPIHDGNIKPVVNDGKNIVSKAAASVVKEGIDDPKHAVVGLEKKAKDVIKDVDKKVL